MAASKSANTYNRQNWEDASFPILCETCLGPSPFVRMMKERYGKECKICCRPFTVFRWCPGPKARFKKTEICQTCAKVKNVCQTCIFDLEFGLPVEVRDKALRQTQQLPRSEVNREYFHQQVEQQLDKDGDITAPYGGHELIGKALAGTSASIHGIGSGGDILLKLARTTPYYRRNRPHICSFWVKGECRRGEECPYRHEKPTDPDDPLSDQNLRDRYYGQDDPVASKLLSKYQSMPKLTPPEDKTITTLYIGGVPDDLTEKDFRDHFYQFGELRSVNIHQKQHCAFLQFVTREAAERAADRSYDRLILRGHRLSVNWGKSPAAIAAAAAGIGVSASGEIESLPPVPGLPLPPAPLSPSLLSTGISTSALLPILGGFFAAPPPPPPLPTNVCKLGDIPRPPATIQIAPPVAELSDGDAVLRDASQSSPTMALAPQLPPAAISAAVLAKMPPPPPPPAASLLLAEISASLKDTNAVPIGGPIELEVDSKTSEDRPSLGVHYPSQNPQRMGSVPQSQRHI